MTYFTKKETTQLLKALNLTMEKFEKLYWKEVFRQCKKDQIALENIFSRRNNFQKTK